MSPLNSPPQGEERETLQRDAELASAVERGHFDQPLDPPGCGSASAGLRKQLARTDSVSPPEGTGALERGDALGTRYWRSLEDLAEVPEFRAIVDREFGTAATEMVTPEERRHFMKVMGASFALAGVALTGCRRLPEQKIAPYASRPENRTPGTPVRYATSMELGGIARPLLATSFDSRPIKVDGNNLHPASLGGSDVFAQASILDLYDQDRSREVYQGDAVASWNAFAGFAAPHFQALAAAQGTGLAFIAEGSASPTLAELRRQLASAMPEAIWAEYEPINDDTERAGTAAALAAPHRVHAVLHASAAANGEDAVHAKVVLSLDCDFLGDGPSAVRLAREFAQTRRVAGSAPGRAEMSRLYMLDGGVTLTGVMADQRLPMRVVDVSAVAAAIGLRLLEALGEPASPALTTALQALVETDSGRAAIARCDAAVLDAAARDLVAHRGASAILVGRSQPPALHAVACLLNFRLGNVTRTITYLPAPEPRRPTCVEALRRVVDGLNGGTIKTVVVIGANPVYTAPADLDFTSALAKADASVHLGYMRDETARRCAWHLPRPHTLESWGDSRSEDGTYTIQQPLIEPMIDPGQGGLTTIEFVAQLLAWAGVARIPADATTQHGGQRLVRSTFASMLAGGGTGGEGGGGGATDRAWRRVLHDGFLAGSATSPAAPSSSFTIDTVVASLGELTRTHAGVRPDAIEVAFRVDPKVYDGRFSNNAWLQELPDPITKLTWDNAAVMSLGTAERLGVTRNDMVRITVDGRSVDAAACPLPGHPDDSIHLTLGYGRTAEAGFIAQSAGFSAYAVRPSTAPLVAIASSVEKIDGSYFLVSTQDRGAGNPVADEGIQRRLPTLVRETTIGHFREDPHFVKHPTKDYHVPHRLSLWEESNLDGARHRWAMSVDLSTCTGCNACVVACQAENNIPIVGKEQVRRGREMQWLRIDRYFRGSDPAHPDRTVFQPVTCLHCENAPCEQVCPVAATLHDEDGLNVMVYNRCVGTRYCSNNCPYKVRRFNYFDWHRMTPSRADNWIQHDMEYYFRDGPNEWKRMQFNPEVTVRMRGVMEKCTFCTQRITEAKIVAKNAWAKAGGDATAPGGYTIPDGTIVTACEAACPAQAIVFGDLNDPTSRVSKLHKDALAYELLEELNTKPRLKYLARLGNPAIEPVGAHAGGQPGDRGHGPATGGGH